MTGNNDFLALGHTLEQGRQMSFGFKAPTVIICKCTILVYRIDQSIM